MNKRPGISNALYMMLFIMLSGALLITYVLTGHWLLLIALMGIIGHAWYQSSPPDDGP